MKVLKLLIIALLFSMSAAAQTTPWSSTPTVTPQTRTLSGSPQIRWIWNTGHIFSVADSLNKLKLYIDSVSAALGGTIYSADGTILTDRFVNTTSYRELFLGDNDNGTGYIDILPDTAGGLVSLRGSDSTGDNHSDIKLQKSGAQISHIDPNYSTSVLANNVQVKLNANRVSDGLGYTLAFDIQHGTSILTDNVNNRGIDEADNYFPNSHDNTLITRRGAKIIADSVKGGITTNLSKYKTKLTPNIQVQYPSWMTFRPFPILEKNGVYFANASQYMLISQKIANMIPYYTDYINGSNANNGLTPQTPVKTIAYAYTTLGARLIYDLTVGVELNDTWGSLNASFTNTDDFFVIGMGRNKTYITSAPATAPTWTLGTSATYSSTVTACKNAVDMAFVDSLGFPLRLTVATSLANCQATVGSFFISGTTINVHLTDGRAPDSKVLVLCNVANATYSANAGYHYVEGIRFMGGGTITGAHGTIAQTGVNNTAVNMSYNCDFLYAESTSYNSNGGEGTRSTYTFFSWHKNDIAYGNARDGFNYEGEVSYRSHVIEENCQGFSNGLKLTSTSVNGSSAHNAMDVVRINDKMYYNSGPNYADVDGVLTFNVGCEAWKCLSFKATGGANQSDYIIDNITSGLDTKMANICCKSADSLVSFRILNPAVNAIMNIDSTTTYRAAFSGAVTVGAIPTSVIASFVSPGLSSYTARPAYEPFVTPGTTSQYYRGDKTFQTKDWVTLAGTNTISATNSITGANTVSAAGSFTFASGTIFSNPPTAAGTYALVVRDVATNQFQKVQTLPIGNGGTGAITLTGLVKGNGTSPFTAAVSNTDYLPVANPNSTGIWTFASATGIIRNTATFQSSTGTTADSLRFASSQKIVDKAVIAGTGITLTQTANTFTIANTLGVVSTTITANQTAAVQNRYVTNNTTRVVVTLPTTAVVGDVIYIVGFGSGGWQVAQNASQVIHGNASDTTVGTAGYVQSQTRYNCAEFRCVVANTDWSLVNSNGNLTTN